MALFQKVHPELVVISWVPRLWRSIGWMSGRFGGVVNSVSGVVGLFSGISRGCQWLGY